MLGHRVAIKLLVSDSAELPSFAARAMREARAAAALKSEHVARVSDVGLLDSGAPYIVMELLEGEDLAHLLRERGPLPVRDVVTYLLQACDAIQEAHALGIVHRDLKPGNLFVARRRDGSPLVKLLDFGISKLVDVAPDEALTTTRDAMGTPHYMSPEQLVSARQVDARTDVWSLGVIAYRLLTQRYPFSGETEPAVHIAIASAPTPSIRSHRPDVPRELDELVARCLIKSREERLQTVAEFAKGLLPLADEETRRGYGHIAGAAAPASAPAPRLPAGAAPKNARRWLGMAGAALAVGTATTLGFTGLVGRRDAPPVAAETPPAPSPASPSALPGTPPDVPATVPDSASSPPTASMPAAIATASPAAARSKPVRSPAVTPPPKARNPYDDRR
jgi:serine/threonine-protein kinase